MANEGFFDERQPQAVLKHGILTRYAPYFAGRAGSGTGNGRVQFVDGYAGAGRYDDGSPGSPLLLAASAANAKLFDRDVRLTVVEAEAAVLETLTANLAAAGVEATIRPGRFDELLPDIAAGLGDDAALFFVDPYSIGITFAQLVDLLGPQRKLDVIYHFSSSTLARLARRVTEQTDEADLQPVVDRLNKALGPVDWDTLFRNREGRKPYEVAVEVCRKFAQAVASMTGHRATVIEVRRRPKHETIYTLVLFSRDKRAHWDYCDQAGLAHIDWLKKCEDDDYRAELEAIQHERDLGVVSLFEALGDESSDYSSAKEPDRSAIDERIADSAVEYLKGWLPRLLGERGGEMRFVDDPSAVYGEWLGRGRAKHVRGAVKQLHKEGVVSHDGTGDFWADVIRLL